MSIVTLKKKTAIFESGLSIAKQCLVSALRALAPYFNEKSFKHSALRALHFISARSRLNSVQCISPLSL